MVECNAGAVGDNENVEYLKLQTYVPVCLYRVKALHKHSVERSVNIDYFALLAFVFSYQ